MLAMNIYVKRWTYNFDPLEPDGVFLSVFDSQTFTVPASFEAGGKWGFRLIKYGTGEQYMSVWPWGQDEASAGISFSMGLANYDPTGTTNLLDYYLAAPNIYAVSVGMPLNYIKVGAIGDMADWPTNAFAVGEGRQLNVCQGIVPVAGWTYFEGCPINTVVTVTNTNATSPEYQTLIGWALDIGNPTPPNSGRALSIRQELGTIRGLIGKPRHYVIKGKFRVPFAATVPVDVVFADYAGIDTPNYGVNNFNGRQLGAFSIMTNTTVDFEFTIDVNDNGNGRWGTYIPNVDQWAQELVPIPGSFLGTGYRFITIDISYYEIFADATIDCTGPDTCGICDDVRCPEIVDSFQSDNYPWFSTPSSVEGFRTTGNNIDMFVLHQDGAQFNSVGNGVGRVTWHGAAVDSFSGFYLVYANSPFECRNDITEDIVATFEFKVNTLSPTSNFGEIGWGGWWDGPQGFLTIGSGIAELDFGSNFVPANVIVDTWTTVEYRTNGLEAWTRVYPTGTTPTAWITTALSSVNEIRQFYIGPGYTQVDTPSNFEVDIKNVVIRRI